MKPLQRLSRAPFNARRKSLRRRGSSLVDYVLVMAAILPMMAMSYYYSLRIIRAVYAMTCTLVCWPFM